MILHNARLVFSDRIARGDLRVRGGRIEAIATEPLAREPEEEFIDLGGQFASPGFIDLHIHGALERNTMEADPEAFRTICRFHAAGGTTSLALTTITATTEASSGSDGAGASMPTRAAVRSSSRRTGHQSPTSAVAAPSAQPHRSLVASVSSAWRAASMLDSVSAAPGVLGVGPTAAVSRTRYRRSRSKPSAARVSHVCARAPGQRSSAISMRPG
jgi:imidazolonepropionase-like amidohydrolase